MSTLSKLLHLNLHRDHAGQGERELQRALATAVTESTRHELMTLAAVRGDR